MAEDEGQPSRGGDGARVTIRAIDASGAEQGRIQHWLAEISGRRIGSVTMVCDQPDVARLRHLRLCAEWRGRGVASRLVEAAAQRAREQGCLKLILDTRTVVRRATELLTYLGFQYAGDKRTGNKTAPQYYIDLYSRPRPHPSVRGIFSPTPGS